jgi:hypothetical protein
MQIRRCIVVQLPKNDEESDFNNYRGNSLLLTRYRIFFQGKLHMYTKLMAMFSTVLGAVDALLIRYSAFVKYLIKIGIHRNSSSAIFRLQESP